MKPIYSVLILSIVFSLIAVACVPPTPEPTSTPQPSSTPEPSSTPQPTSTPESSPTPVLTTSEEFVTAGWKAYERNEFDLAVELAQECVNKWESEAIKQQSELTEAPPNGKVSADEKKAIFANWALNDVATAYFIIGELSQKLGKADEAKKAYTKATEFAYGRAWDPQGWFWAPAEEAENRLAKMP